MGKYMFTSKDFMALIQRHEKEAEKKAQNSLDRGKYIMYGYWKAIAVHMRKMQREVKKEMGLC